MEYCCRPAFGDSNEKKDRVSLEFHPDLRDNTVGVAASSHLDDFLRAACASLGYDLDPLVALEGVEKCPKMLNRAPT